MFKIPVRFYIFNTGSSARGQMHLLAECEFLPTINNPSFLHDLKVVATEITPKWSSFHSFSIVINQFF